MTQSLETILIAGAGPVGMTAAALLVRAGFPVTVLEREPGLPEDMRASTFHPATLDLLDDLGFATALVDEGTRVPRWQYRVHETGRSAVFDLDAIADATAFPFRLQCEQFRYVRLLVDHLRDNPLFTLRRGARVTGVERVPDHVRVHYQAYGEQRQSVARWLIAADGGRSTVRNLLDLDFKGSVFPKTSITLVLDHPFQDHVDGLLGANYVWSDHGHFSLMRVRDLWRFSYSPDPGQSIDEALAEPAAQARLQQHFPSTQPYRILQANHYTLQQRCLDNFVQGAVLFAGDSAHLNSPAGGMGMNSGIHDAFSLIEHLVPVLRGRDSRHLDRYDRRRRGIALHEVQRVSSQNYARHRETDPSARTRIMDELVAIAGDPSQAREFLLDSSMINALRREKEIQ